MKNIEKDFNYKYHCLHVNIQSLPAKFDNLKSIIGKMSTSGISLDFILLCETFLTDHNADQYCIPGYNLIYKNRTQKKQGGVAIFIKDKYNFKVREDLSIFKEGEVESLFLEINSKDHKKF